MKPIYPYIPLETYLSDEECISTVTLFIVILSIDLKTSSFAELLAIIPCTKLFQELKKNNRISPVAPLCFGDYIKEYQANGNLAKGADGLIENWIN